MGRGVASTTGAMDGEGTGVAVGSGVKVACVGLSPEPPGPAQPASSIHINNMRAVQKTFFT